MSVDAKYAWYFVTTEFRWLWIDLARAVEASTGLKPLLLVNTPEDEHFYRTRSQQPYAGDVLVILDVYSSAVSRAAVPSPSAADYRRLAEWEHVHGMSTMRAMILADRHLGRAYNTTGVGHPTSRISRRAESDVVFGSTLSVIDFLENAWRQYPPGLVICQGAGFMFANAVQLMARCRAVPFRSLTHTRFGQTYYWADDLEGNSSLLRARIEAEPPVGDDDVADVLRTLRPTGDFAFHLARMKKRLNLTSLVSFVVRETALHAYRRLRRQRKARIGYHLHSEIAYIFRQRAHWRYLTSSACPRLDLLPRDRKIVFFPLQVEPEPSLSSHAPHLTNQLATAMEISLSLPADCHLAIKEHPIQVGRRSMRIYKSLQALPNVSLVNIHERSYDLIRRSTLVVAVNSSAAYEAAAMGVPAAMLSGHGLVHAMAHVRYIPSLNALDGLVDWLAVADDDAASRRRRRDGAKFLRAMRRNGMSFDGLDIFNRDRVADTAEIEMLVKGLLESLVVTPLAKHADAPVAV